MNYKLLLSSLFLITFSGVISPQTPYYRLSIANDAFIGNNVYEFDVFLDNASSPNIFELCGLSMGITYNSAILNGGTLTCTMIAGTSELNAADQPNSFNTALDGVIRIPARNGAGAGSGTIIPLGYFSTRVCRLRITNSKAFSSNGDLINLAFATTSPYPTSILAYVPGGGGGTRTNITTSGYFDYELWMDYPPPACLLKAINPIQIDRNNIEFDIALIDTLSTFPYYGGNYCFDYNSAIANGGSLSLALISSELPIRYYDTLFQITSSYFTIGQPDWPPPLISGYTITKNVQIIIGHFRLSNTNTFSLTNLGLTWRKSGDNPITKLYYTTNNVGFEGTPIETPSENISYSELTPDIMLPVELSSFTSASQGRSVVLNWSTSTEKNSDRFEIERTYMDQSSWHYIGSVKAAVLSNSPKNYSFTDTKLLSGKYNYRIKMIDNDGSFNYSDVIEEEISIPSMFDLSQNYPNPWNPTTKIDYQLPVDVRVILEVYNIAGQRVAELVNQDQSAGYYTMSFESSGGRPSGIYIYRLTAIDKSTGKSFSSVKKMMMVK